MAANESISIARRGSARRRGGIGVSAAAARHRGIAASAIGGVGGMASLIAAASAALARVAAA